MPTTVAIGSVGTFVNELQRFLNELHSDLVRLKADGIFGPKTRERVMEFQSQNQLVEDGVVGPITWERLYELMVKLGMDLTDKTFGNNLGRQAVVAIANAEASAQLNVVAAKQSGGPDPQNPKKLFRKGYQHLLKYFRISAPKQGAQNQTYFNEDVIRYLTTVGKLEPMAHWCGIFALWAIKTAMMPVGIWKMGQGISSVTGFKQIAAKAAASGDVGYVHSPFEHHFIIKKVYQDEHSKWWASTIEGNSSPNSNFSFKERELSSIDRFYSCF